MISQHYADSKYMPCKIMAIRMFGLGEAQQKIGEAWTWIWCARRGLIRCRCVYHNVNAATSLTVHDAVLLACPTAR